MALTEPATMRDEEQAAPAALRRSLTSRLSIGHVVMILAGLVAILLNLAFLRSSTESVMIAVARVSLQPGTVLEEGSVARVEVGDAGELAEGLLTYEAAAGLYGRVLAGSVAAGEPLRRSDLRPTGTASGLREYSLKIDNSEAAGGLIEETDLVDVIATIEGRSFYVAAGLEVVKVTRQGTGLEVGDELIIVLSVDDRTALQLTSAQETGAVAFVRSTGAEPPVSGPVSLGSTGTP